MLVDYSSDSDNEDSPKETPIEAVKDSKPTIQSTTRPMSKSNGFARLPKPKKPSKDAGFGLSLPNPLQTTIKDIEEEDDENDDDNEIERPAIKRARLNGPSSSSLFSSLSAPKNTGPPPPATSKGKLSLRPPSVKSKAPSKPISAPSNDVKAAGKSEKSKEKENAVSFFDLGPTIGPAPRPTTTNPIKINPSIYTSTAPETNLIHNPDGTSYYHDGPVDEIAIQQQYSHHIPASANVIDVPDPRDRTMEPERPTIIYDTSESDKIAAQNGDYKPSAVAKYKHTLGSLIHEARAKHAEYQERFAANRRAKREAGARYGF